MSNRYAGYCADCQREVDAGHGELRRETGRWVVRCGRKASNSPTPAAPIPTGVKTYNVGSGSGYGGHEYTTGRVYRNTQPGEPTHLLCLEARKRYIREDGMSFGVGDESGYLYSAVCREATAEEAAPLIQAERRTVELKAAKGQLAELAKRVQATGERPTETQIVDGERLFDTQDVYGGGSWWVVQSEAIWYVQNNGADGDNWSSNNVRTGGAGAIGWRVARIEDLVTSLYGLRDILAGTIEDEAKTAQILAMAVDARLIRES